MAESSQAGESREPLISIRGLTRMYDGYLVFKNIDADIYKGDVIAVIGPSGAGKSAFLRCLNALETPTSGDILFEGQSVVSDANAARRMREKMGMVFQSFNLFSHLMVSENIMLAPQLLRGLSKQEAFDETCELLATVGLKNKRYSYPDELSGGQRQRVAIARALAMHPEIILFDEPTSALDPTMVSEVLSVIRSLASQGMTMIIVTHEMKFAQDVSNRVFYLDDQSLYEQGTPDQIFETPKRSKTRAFIKRIRSFEYHVTNRDFDFLQLFGALDAFGKKQFFSPRTQRNIALVVEELLMNKVIPLYAPDDLMDINILVEATDDQKVFLQLSYSGDECNVLIADDEDDISMAIVSNLAASKDWAYDEGVNQVRIVL